VVGGASDGLDGGGEDCDVAAVVAGPSHRGEIESRWELQRDPQLLRVCQRRAVAYIHTL
jgi:hypothetical protein